MLVVVLVLLALLGPLSGYNLEPRHAIVISDPDYDPGSYFGYALGFWRQSSKEQNTTWLLVGAPRGKVKYLTGDRVRQPGAVYKCSLAKANSSHCHMIPLLAKEERIQQDLFWRRKIVNIPARSWIGGTIAVEDKPNGAIVVCAPRMKRQMQRDAWFIPGTCFYWKHETDVNTLATLDKVYPYRRQKVEENGFYAGLAQVGMSAQFVPNSSTSQLVVGAPGITYFKGAMSVYEQDPRWGARRSLSSLHMPTVTETKLHYYLGKCELELNTTKTRYSVTSARLHSDGRVSYVAGAPRADGAELFTGAVYVMEDPHGVHWTVVSTLKGYQMGEYFGASVVALDLDLDGRDDLLVVGAPLYSHQAADEGSTAGDQGRVYIFRNKGEAVMSDDPKTLKGSTVAGARFGTSLAVIGDLNMDGFNDLAVGAPYEGSGSVYIYHGGDDGIQTKPSQKISAHDIRPDLAGFGFSIVSGVDVDGNSFNDIAIGSYEAASAVVVKSYPVISFEAFLKPNVSKLNIDAKNFTVEACLGYTSRARSDLLHGVEAQMIVRVDPSLRRAVFANSSPESATHEQRVRLRRDHVQCWPLDVKLKENLFQVVQPIEMSMDYKILDDSSTDRKREFCKLCPVTDPHKPATIHVKVPLAKDYKEKEVSRADLKVEASSSNLGNPLVLGKDSRITLNVTVSNSGEPAYNAKMSFKLPKKKMLVKLPKNCYQNGIDCTGKARGEVIMCEVGNPLFSDTNSTKNRVTMHFELDLNPLPLKTSMVVLNLTVCSDGEERTFTDNSLVLEIPVKLVTRVDITGYTMQKTVILAAQEENQQAIVPVSHKYGVINYGPSPVGEVRISFKVPVGVTRGLNPDVLGFVKFPDPQVTIGGNTYRCDVNVTVLDNFDIKILLPSHWDTDDRQRTQGSPDMRLLQRRRRSLAAANDTVAEGLQAKRTLYLNCTSEIDEVVCVVVTCLVGPLTPNTGAEVDLQLHFNTSIIESLLKDVDAIQLSTVGRVDIEDTEIYEVQPGHRYDVASVETVFMRERTGDEVPPWILPLAISTGLLALLLVVKLLSNIGFFRRGARERLELMKEKAAEEEFVTKEFLDKLEDELPEMYKS